MAYWITGNMLYTYIMNYAKMLQYVHSQCLAYRQRPLRSTTYCDILC
jgi:hypothetical protein